MPYIADMRKTISMVQAGKLMGNGQCVSLIHAVTVIPPASTWRRGLQVKNSKNILRGTIIATFDRYGHYGNQTNGTSHAAIYLYQTPTGIVVIDQWKGHGSQKDHAPQQRTIHFDGLSSLPVNKGDNYYVVE
ncbi:BPSL0067 family protein [Dyella acidiphila]|uniref:BPSL0067 family protein n=1 Tax=Dyella acidiphila TaxID=2775866 RepID=A0ABR9G4X5_9GAMM|nr:BPSL0067 family protein [Dyella acidiphila]MBE1159104.1 BPSL0067 family protein [Dyella acidiphila]